VVTRRRALLAVAALAVAGAIAGVVLLARGVADSGNGGSALPNGVPLAVQATIAPTVALFGDPVQARLDVAVDRRKVDPDRLRIATDFRPFERLDTHRTTRDAGRITYIRQTYALRCLSRQCLQVLPSVAAAAGGARPSGRRATLFRPARVFVAGSSTVSPLLIQWPTVETLTRVNQAEAQLQTFFYHATLTPPDPSYAFAPRTLLGILVLGVLVALAIPVALVLRRLEERRRAQLPQPKPELPPLERALRLLEWANRQSDGEDRRRALELVAVELLRGGEPNLGAAARELAWSPSSPPADEAGRLGAQVRSATGGDGASPE
jgi:hypothetical protein